MALPQIFQAGIVNPARLMDAPGELVKVAAGAAQQGHHLLNLRQFQIHYKPPRRFSFMRARTSF